MRKTDAHGCRLIMAVLSFALAASSTAAPVSRNEAFSAATAELPKFYAGIWNLSGEFLLYNLSDEASAFVFVFERGQKLSNKTPAPAPAAFVAKVRADLAAAGKAVSGYEPELHGADRYATIVISADDTEPPVLRCFLGLPPQIVREANALALAADKGGAGSWRVRHYLMLGFFDEAFAVEPSAGSNETLIVDLRRRVAVTEKEAKTRALIKRATAADPELIRMSQEAWGPYRSADKTPDVPSSQKESVSGEVTKKEVANPLPPPPRKGSVQ